MEAGPAPRRPRQASAPPRYAEPKPEQPKEAVATETAPEPVAAPVASEATAEPDQPEPAPADAPTAGVAESSGRPDLTATVMSRLAERRVYPIAARRRGAEGDVVVRFTLRPDGTIADVAAESADAHPLLRRAAVDSVVAAAPFPLPAGLAGDMEFAVTIAYRLSD